MHMKTAVRIILVVVSVAVVSIGGYSIYHYGQVAPMLHNKQLANNSGEQLAQQGPSNDPSAAPLQVMTIDPTNDQSAGSSTTPSSMGQVPPSPGLSHPRVANVGNASAASPQAPTTVLQTQPVGAAVQGVAGGILNGVSASLQP